MFLSQPKTGTKLSISQIYSKYTLPNIHSTWKISFGLNEWWSLTYVIHSYLHTSKIVSVLLKLPLCEIFKLCLLGFQSTKNNCAKFGQIATQIQIWHHKIPILFEITCHICNRQDSIWGRNKYEKIGGSLNFSTFILWNSQIWLDLLVVDCNLC